MAPTEGRVAKPERWWDCNIPIKHQFQQLSRQQQTECNAATPSSASSHWKIQDSRQIKKRHNWLELRKCNDAKQRSKTTLIQLPLMTVRKQGWLILQRSWAKMRLTLNAVPKKGGIITVTHWYQILSLKVKNSDMNNWTLNNNYP